MPPPSPPPPPPPTAVPMDLQAILQAGDSIRGTSNRPFNLNLTNYIRGLAATGANSMPSYNYTGRTVRLQSGATVVLPRMVLITQDAATKAFFDEIFLSPNTNGQFDLVRTRFASLEANSRFAGDTLYIMAGTTLVDAVIPNRANPGVELRRDITPSGFPGSAGGVTYGEVITGGVETADDTDRFITISPLGGLLTGLTNPLDQNYMRGQFIGILAHEALGHLLSWVTGGDGAPHAFRDNSDPFATGDPAATAIIHGWTTNVAVSDPNSYKVGFDAAQQYFVNGIDPGAYTQLVQDYALAVRAVAYFKLEYLVNQVNAYAAVERWTGLVLGVEPFSPQQLANFVTSGLLVQRPGTTGTSLAHYTMTAIPTGVDAADAARRRAALNDRANVRATNQLTPEQQAAYDQSLRIQYTNAQGQLVTIFNLAPGVTQTTTTGTTNNIETVETTLIDQPSNLTVSSGTNKPTTVRVTNSPVGFDFVDAGEQLGAILGNTLAKGNVLGQVVASAALKTIGANLGDALNLALFDKNGHAARAVSESGPGGILGNIDIEFLANLKSAGIGALSSFLTAELVKALGVDGFAGELLNTTAGSVIGQIITNLTNLGNVFTVIENGVEVHKITQIFTNVGPQLVLTAAASFLGTKLAQQVMSFNTVGGQIGSALGSSLGALGAVALVTGGGSLASTFGALGLFAGPAGALIGAFLGFLVGGLIGSLFGGTPVSGADAVWNEGEQRFTVANVYSKHGGSKDAAKSVTNTVAETLNGVMGATAGRLEDASKIQTGNYGMRGSNFVYRSYSTRDKSAITQTFKGKEAASDLMSYGIYQALSDPDFKLIGGDNYVKRAVYLTVENTSGALNFDLNQLLGNITVAERFRSVIDHQAVVSALTRAESDSVFAAEAAVALAAAYDLGLHKRHRSDWFGGFGSLLDETGAVAENVYFGFVGNGAGSISRRIEIGDYTYADSVNADHLTTIESFAGDQIIDLRTGKLADQSGYRVNGHFNDDIALSGTDFTAHAGTAISFAATELRKSVAVTIANDGLAEATQRLLGELSDGAGVSIIGGAAEAIIIDGAAATPTLVVGRSYALEGDGHAVFRVTLSNAATGAVTASLAAAALNATADTDFGAGIEISADGLTGWTAATSLSFAAGQTEQFVRIAVTADNGTDAQGKPTNVEGNERFTLTATVTAGAGLIANAADIAGVVSAAGTATIVDATMGTAPLAWIDSVTVDEATGQAVFSIARSRSGETSSLTFATADRRELTIGVAATADAGEGNDTIHASNLGDNLFGGAGNDTLYGGRLDDWLLGGDGNDTLNAGSSGGALGGDGNYLTGGAGDDQVIGREGSDWLEGGDGTDTLEGGDGDDILDAGMGAGDLMRGGRGDDQYIFRIGDVGSTLAAADMAWDEGGLSVQSIVTQAYNDLAAGELSDLLTHAVTGALFRSGRGLDNWHGGGVQVAQNGAAAGGEDVLILGYGIGLEDIKLVKSADAKDLIIELWPEGAFAGDRIALKDWFSSFNKIETLRFADGNEVRIADFDTFMLGTDGSETIIGTSGHDFVHAGGGNDLVYLLSGNDFGNGGLGNDTVTGNGGNDTVVGADGDDVLMGDSGLDAVSGGRGNDVVYGDVGNDIVSGGAGDDEVIGGKNDDVFKFGRGDGRDTFIDALTDEWELVWQSGPGWQNGYVLNENGTIADSTTALIFDGQHWSARIRYEIDTGKLWRHKPANADAIVLDHGTDSIEFGIGIDINDIQIVRSNGDRDLILGIEPAAIDTFSFSALTDQILLREWGPSGSAAARGSIESFVFFNTGALDVSAMQLDGGTDGNDNLTGAAGSRNWITGGAGDDQVTGGSLDDIVGGNGGQDRLIGLGGADTLLGGADNDVLIGGAGTGLAGDRLVGGDGLDVASYETATSGVQASLEQPKAAGDAFAGDAAGDSYDSVEGLRGSDFADQLDGDIGENELDGRKGNDVLKGGLGDDLYIFGRGDGQDSIDDQYAASKAVVVDGAGNLESPYVARMDLIEREGGLYRFEHVVAHSESGEVVYRRLLDPTADRELVMPSGFDSAGWVLDEQGNPIYTVTGSEVADVAPAGPAGSDTLLFQDYTGVAGYSGEQAIGLSDLNFAFDGNDLLISLVGSPTDQVRLKNFRIGASVDSDRAIEKIAFSDGSAIHLAGLKFDSNGALLSASTDTLAEPIDSFIVGAAGDQTLIGGYGDDALSGLDGNDWLQGGDGNDLLSGGAGYDILHGGAGVDTVTYAGSDGGTGVTINILSGAPGSGGEASGDNFNSIENVTGSHFNDTITGNTADNVLKGNRGNDTVTGGLGADVLLGDDGNDTLTGNVHDDNLDGGAGNDVLNGGGDRDVLSGGDGNDILRGDGVTGYDAGGNLIANFGFENSGNAADDVTQSYGLTTDDLPSWTLGAARPAQLTTSASGVNPSEGTRSIHLDDDTDNVEISQTIKGLDQDESFTLMLSSAGRTTDSSSSFEVLWNGEVVISVANGTTTMATRVASLAAKEGDNILTIRGTGDVDGLGAIIDNVRLTRSVGGTDQLIGGAGIDRLEGGNRNDTLLGGDGNDSASQIVTGTTVGGLYGGGGDDLLEGGAGDDTLDGGSGADRYVFRTGSGNDNVVIGGGADELIFDKLDSKSLWFSQPAGTQDLLITAIGGGASVRVTNWFSSADNQARRIVAGGRMLSRFDVQGLVTAMAAQSATVPTLWPASPAQAFTDALAAAWQDGAAYADRAVLTGTAGNDYLVRETIMVGADRLDVWLGPVRYEGLAGNDIVEAGSSDDIIIGGAGDDMLFGGPGSDEFRFGVESGLDLVDGSDGTDSIVATANSARINLNSVVSVERISGAGFADVQIVTASGITLDLSGMQVEGIAQINGAAGAETIIGGAGGDRILGSAGDDALSGGLGDDWIQGGDGTDTHDGGAGLDTLDQSFAAVAQTIDLGTGQIVTTGGIVETATGFENVLGGSGDDSIVGSAGDNRLDGNGGADALDGGDGGDLLIGGAGSDSIGGGTGSDTASYETQAAASAVTSVVDGVTLDGVVVNLASASSVNGTTPPASADRAKQGDADGDWFYQVENLRGSNFNDSLTGDGGANRLYGGAGQDLLYGGLGDDIAVFAGNRADYEIQTTGLITIQDLNSADGDEGSDILRDVEFVQFADMTISLGINPNNPPQVGVPPLADQVWNDGQVGSYQIPATAFFDLDPEDILAFTATLADGSALPSWLTFAPATGTFQGTPSLAMVGNVLQVKVTAADADYSVSDIFLITVAEAPGADVNGTPGDDVLAGTFRRETMIGGAGADVLQGSGGADLLDGGTGLDTADYSASGSAVTVNLAGTSVGGDADGDQYISVENVAGSDLADTITGSADADSLLGGAGADVIDGAGGDDLVDGGSGIDTLEGGAGNDSLYSQTLANGAIEDVIDGGAGADALYLTAGVHGAIVDLAVASGNLVSIEHVVGTALADTLGGNDAANILSGGGGDDIMAGAGGADTLYGGAGHDSLRGDGGDNVLYGEAGDDRLLGGSGHDQLYGGAGTDIVDYRASAQGVAINLGSVLQSGGDADGDKFEDGQIENAEGSDFSDSITGTAAVNVLKGFAGDDMLDGGTGADTLIGAAGNDIYVVDNAGDVVTEAASEGSDTLRTTLASYALGANVENLTYTGASSFTGTGNSLANVITGGAGADTLDGGTGADTLIGAAGNDTYVVDNAGDVVTEAASEGTDTVRTTLASYALGSNVENLTYIGGSAFTGTGNSLANVITGGAGADTLDGGTGADTLIGGAGNDIYVVDNAGDVVTEAASEGTDTVNTALASHTLAANVENLTYTGGSAFAGTGNSLANAITGGAGADTLDGGTGADTLIGAAGNDTYVVDNAGDTVTEAASEGTDLVRTTLASYALGANVENLTYTGASSFTGTGNSLANVITGGTGADTLTGGAGNDTYVLDNAGDTVTEAASEGTDTVVTTLASYALGANVENLNYTGGSAFTGTGNSLANAITGGAGADTLDGGTGADTLVGAAGNDIYVVDNAGDVVTEAASEGTDTVRTTLASYALGANVENLTYIGGSAFTGTGNSLANVITGGAGADTLDGGTGADTLIGAAGNDTYVVDNAGDVVTEAASEGTDTVRTTLASYALGSNVENLTYIGGSAFTGTGNSLANVITGGAGADTLDGGTGADTLIGAAGNDIYVVDNAGDVVTEASSEGTDTVNTALASHTLAANVENLTYTGASSFTGTGNSLANVITGGGGNDSLSGGAGNDGLYGGLGNDFLEGGAGSDVFDGGGGTDTVSYLASTAGANFSSGAIGGSSFVVGGVTHTVATAVTLTLNGVDVDLTLGTAANADAAGNSFLAVENLTGSINHDRLTGTNASTTVIGRGGNDVIKGGAGDDILWGDDLAGSESGDDIIYGEEGQDLLYGGAGNDRLFGGGARDELYGGAGNDVLDAGDYGDLLDGGTGDDTLTGGQGGDMYLFNRTSGSDTIYNYDDDSAQDAVDIYYNAQDLANSIINTDLWFTKSGKDLIVKLLGTTNQMIVKDWFTNTTAGDWTAADGFYIDVFISGEKVNGQPANMPTLLGLMKDIAEPASFASLTAQQRTQIESAWDNNMPPSVVAVAGNPVSGVEPVSPANPTAIQLKFKVDDLHTPDSSVSLSASYSNGLFQTGAITVDGSDPTGQTRILTLTPTANAHGLTTITLTASDGIFFSQPLVVSVRLLASADPVTVSAPVSATGNAGAVIFLPGSLAAGKLALIQDTDSEKFDYVRIEAVPVGAILSDGTNSFTSAAGATTATVTTWNLASIRITPPANSGADFTLTLKTRSYEDLQDLEINPGAKFGAEATTTIAVNVNGRPTGAGFAYGTPQFSENVSNAAGLFVGTLSAVDPGDATGVYAYAVTGAETARFEVKNGNQLWLKPNVSLDYEAGNASVGIRITDNTTAAPLIFDGAVTVRPLNVNESPTGLADINAAANSVAENVAAGTLVGITLSATDPEGAALTYSITSDPMNWFQVNATTGAVSIRAGAAVNYEALANGTTTINVQASDGATAPATLNGIVINILDVNETPSFTSAASASMSENVAAGTLVSTITSSDPDKDALAIGEAGHFYSIVGGTGSALFEIVSSNQIRTKAGTSFNYEGGPTSYTLTLRVRDNNNTGLSVDQVFTVNIANVNEAPSTPAAIADQYVYENAAFSVGLSGSVDPESAEVDYAFTASGNPGGLFAIDNVAGNGGTLRLVAPVNFESIKTQPYYVSESATRGYVDVRIVGRDPALNNSGERVVRVHFDNVNEAPAAPTISSDGAAAVNENTVAVRVATLTAVDPEGTAPSFVLTGAHAAHFTIVGNEVWTKANLDYEALGGSLTASAAASDGSLTGASWTKTVTLLNVNETPSTPAAIADQYVNENAAFSVALSGSVDPEALEVNYAFTSGGNPGGIFAIDNVAGNSGTLRLIAPVDYEWLRTQSFAIINAPNRAFVEVRFVATDPAGNVSSERLVIIAFDNLNDSAPAVPSVSSWGTVAFDENTGAGAVVATFAPSDPDGTLNPLFLELTSNPGGMFQIVGNQVRVVSGSNFNFEAFASSGASTQLAVGVRASDGTNVSGSYSFNVQLNNVDDNLPTAGGVSMQNGYSTTILENTVTPLSGLVIARAVASDVDGDALTYSIVAGNVASTFTIDANGYISAPNGIDFEGMGGAATLATDPSIPVSLTIRASQASNPGRYVDQVLNLTIADGAELQQIYDGSGLITCFGTNNLAFSSAGFAAGFAGTRVWIGGMSALYFRTIIIRDSNGDGVFTMGTDQTIFDRREDTGQTFVAVAGYRWETAYTSGPPPAGVRFIKDLPPVVLDLNGDGLFASTVSVSFDVDGDGARDQVGWIAEGDAFLALDRDGNGLIDKGGELSFINDLAGAQSDLEGLAAFDSNGDGLLDAADAQFGAFLVWQDSNQDGISDPGELKTLAEAGVASISLTRTANTAATPDTANQVLLGAASFTYESGATGQVGDVALRWESGTPALVASPVPANDRIAVDLDGNGTIDPATEVVGQDLPSAGFDSNGDGLISASDEHYYDLRLWSDVNGNGRAEPGELSGLDRAGLTAINAVQPIAAPVSPPAQPTQTIPPPSGPAAPTPPTAPQNSDSAGTLRRRPELSRHDIQYH